VQLCKHMIAHAQSHTCKQVHHSLFKYVHQPGLLTSQGFIPTHVLTQ
jgi:hypothetical protein